MLKFGAVSGSLFLADIDTYNSMFVGGTPELSIYHNHLIYVGDFLVHQALVLNLSQSFTCNMQEVG